MGGAKTLQISDWSNNNILRIWLKILEDTITIESDSKWSEDFMFFKENALMCEIINVLK